MAAEVYIADLEKHWLEAESKADELKHEAERTRSKDLFERHAEAEQAASEAFDRLWIAKDVGGATQQMSAK